MTRPARLSVPARPVRTSGDQGYLYSSEFTVQVAHDVMEL